jgi:ankyrin repeat protein
MKLLFEVTKLNPKNDPSQIILSFFFHARGTVEEKSITGLYCSLLHQLFREAVELKDSLEWMTVDGARAVQRSGWHEEALKQTLKYAIKKLRTRPLMIFIDALDECDDHQATSMVGFFEELCDIAREAKVQLKICFSSRHYPVIDIQNGIEVILEDEIGHTEDIKQYIKSNLRVGKIRKADTLQSDILEKSSCIFLWVVLVVGILNSEYRNGSTITKIRSRLEEIPSKLKDLFEMIITRDGENLDRLQICLKWILFATRPLELPELYFATQISIDKECSGFWDQDDVDLDQMKVFMRSSCKGLAEVTRKASEVQFIHESVREFLLSKYEDEWSRASSNFVGHSHEMLKNCCLAQLNVSISQDVDIAVPLPRAFKAAQLRETINLKFPFLKYSVLNVLRHANNAQQNTIEQREFLTEFPLQRWIFFNNTLEQRDIRWYKDSVSFLYILAERNLADLIRIHSMKESCFDVEDERYGLPIFAALATGSYEAVQTFLEVQAETHPQESSLRRLCKQYSENRDKRMDLGRNFTFSQQRGVSSYIGDRSDEVILLFLLALGKLDIESKDNIYGRTPLSWATGNRCEAVVKLLLEKGADIESEDNCGRTPLWWAIWNRNKAIVKLLLEKGANSESRDNRYGQTSLSSAAENGYEAMVKLLPEKGADNESSDHYSRTPLLLAIQNGCEAVVKLLLEKGVNIEAKYDGQTPLLFAAENGYEVMVKLLLDKGADIESRDYYNQTPLLLAIQNRRKAVVKLLREKRAQIHNNP